MRAQSEVILHLECGTCGLYWQIAKAKLRQATDVARRGGWRFNLRSNKATCDTHSRKAR